MRARWSSLGLSLVLLGVCSLSSAVAQAQLLSGEVVTPVAADARSLAMGRTDLVSAAHGHALFSNPALLAGEKRMSLALDGRLSMAFIEPHEDEGESNEASEGAHLAPSGISFVLPWPGDSLGPDWKLVLGAGYHYHLDGGGRGESERRQSGSNESTTSEYSSSGGLGALSAGAGVAYAGWLRFGLSVHRTLFARITTESEERRSGGSGSNETTETETDITGTFATLGVTADVGHGVTLAAVYVTGHDLDLDVEETQRAGDASVSGDADIDVEVPGALGLGVSYRLSPEWLFAAELRRRAFSDYEVEGHKSQMDDAWGVRLGAEHGVGGALLRGGLFADPVMVADQGEDEPKTLLGVSLGLGMQIWGVAVDVAGEFGQYTVEYDRGSDHVQRPLRVRLGVARTF